MIREHLAAVEALLTDFPMTIYADGQVPDRPTFPYAVLHVGARSEGQSKLCNDTDLLRFRFQITSVALTNGAALRVADAARSRLVDVRPTVTGRRTDRIKPGVSLPISKDETFVDPDTGLHPQVARDTFSFDSRPL